MWLAPSTAHAACPTSITVASGGSTTIDADLCNDFGTQTPSLWLVTPPNHGTVSMVNNEFITYTNKGSDAATSDSFVWRDASNVDWTVTVTIGGTPAYPAVTLSPTSAPNGTVGSAYSLQFSASGGDGGPYSYHISQGILPDGVSDNNAGLVSGTPTESGSFTFTESAEDGHGNVVQQTVTLTINGGTISISPSGGNLPDATAYQPYSKTLTASGGTGPYTFSSVTYSWPPTGITIGSNGTISGTVTALGTTNFSVQVKDSTGASTKANYVLQVVAPTITVSPASLPDAIKNVAYGPQTLSATGGTSPYTYSISSGSLPNGTTLSGNQINGAPTATGTSTFTVKATDAHGFFGTQSLSITVNSGIPGAPTVGTATAGDAQATVAFSAPASNGGAPITSYTATSSPGGKSGTCASSPCTVTGLTNGTAYTFTVTATNSAATGPASAASNSVTPKGSQTITFNNPGTQNFGTSPTLTATATSNLAPTFTSSTTGVCTVTSGGKLTFLTAGNCTIDADQAGNGAFLAAPTVSQTFNVVTVQAVANPVPATVAYGSANTPITLNITGGAPTSVAVGTQATHGTATASGTSITYTPTAGYAGPDSFTYTATNASGTSAPATVTITVSPPTITYSPVNPPAGTVNVAYSQSLAGASGGTAPYTYAVTTGTLPQGLTLNANDGTLHGTPTTSGPSTFKVTAKDSSTGTGPFSSAPADVTVTINPAAAPTVGAVSATVGYGSGANPITLNITGGAATSVAIAMAASHGMATPTGTSITYKPNPGYAGPDSFNYTATNASGTSAPATVTITVSPPAITYSPANPPAGTVNVTYSQSLAGASGGTAPYTYAVTTGTLPQGLALEADGTLHGTPTASGPSTFKVTAKDSSTGTGPFSSAPADVTVTINGAVPTIAGVAPNSGSTAGGTAVTITGTNFTGATAVTFDGAAATSFTVVSGTSITATTPAHTTAGAVAIAVTAPGGNASLPNGFTYSAPLPTVTSHTLQLTAGASGTVNLTQGATGGPFTAATVATPPPASDGTASIVQNGAQWQLVYASALTAASTVVVRYTLSNASGTSAPGTVTFTVVTRPDPSRDREVIGLLNAQAQSAQRFAQSQITNFRDRLEQLHNDSSREATSMNVRLGAPQDPTDPNALGYARETRSSDPTRNAFAYAPNDAGDSRRLSGKTPAPKSGSPSDLAFWAGGFVNFGTSNRYNIDLGHTLIGVSGGMDYRFSPSFTAGIGLGYGRDTVDFGTNGTQSNGQAFSTALYGSYHPRNNVFIDGLLGYSALDFGSRRFVTSTSGFATGDRSGDQAFGSLSTGYEYKGVRYIVSPYGRIEAAWTQLNAFTENGAPFTTSPSATSA